MKLTLLTFLLMIAVPSMARALEPCLSKAESDAIVKSLNSGRKLADGKKIRKELVELVEDRQKLENTITRDMTKKADLIPKVVESGRKNVQRVCRLLVENGWMTRSDIGDEGYEAMLLIIGGAEDAVAQRSMIDVLIEASKAKLLEKSFLAGVVDGIRVGFGAPQLFGTKAKISKNAVYVYPLLDDDKVDAWRAAYGMPPLAVQMKRWELSYLMPVVRAPRRSQSAAKKANDADVVMLGIESSDDEPLVVESRLVNLNIRLLLPDTQQDAGLKLTKDDFIVQEDGVVQETSFFSDTGTPFDIVLLLDFSGSTEGKQGLIKKSAKRFVDAVRPDDRIAIVAFASQISLMSDFTSDKAQLRTKVDQIKEFGMSPIWDSVRFVYDTLLKTKSPGRRTAIVMMTDAFDNSRKTNFADAVEIARRGETTIFPVFVPTSGSSAYARQSVKGAETSLELLAGETGGQVFRADDLKDLDRVYETIAGAVGRVYSLGYEPKDEARTGGWRTLTVKVKGRPELIVLTRQGYYAN